MIHRYGLIGYPLGHSYSPQIHKAVFQLTGIQGEYSLMEIPVNQIPEFFKGVKEKKLEGFNVTIPHKQAVMAYMDDISEEARRIGAVNCVSIMSNGLIGTNTDYFGFQQLLLKNCGDVKDKRVLILGDGGSARTVYTCLCDMDVSVCYIASRKPEQVKDSFPKACVISYEEVYRLKELFLVVNCTPVGMYPHMDESPLLSHGMDPFPYCIDLIYNPARTKLMDDVEKAGGKGINGLYMLIAQAVAAQEIWRQEKISDDVINKVLWMMERNFV